MLALKIPFRTLCFNTLVIFLSGCAHHALQPGQVLNDVHSRLNPTRVAEIHYPESTEDLVRLMKMAKRKRMAVSISGGRHAMGGQQFGTNTLHIRMTQMNDLIAFDREQGVVRIEAGMAWPKLIEQLTELQKNSSKAWAIVQKPTGADDLSLGGSLSANVHGRGVKFKPMIQDVIRFTLVNADGEVLEVSRDENPELFRLVIGGYGLFGIIATVDLKLTERLKLERIVELVSAEELAGKTAERLQSGFLYGDYQYKTDETASDFMKTGVFSAYRPVAMDTPVAQKINRLSSEKWNELLYLAHVDKAAAFDAYSRYYLTTNGQIYWSDLFQLSYYNDEYVEFLRGLQPELGQGSLMITELYVPRPRLNDFIERVAEDARNQKINIIYGTMRLIEKDDESFLAWAKQDYACVIFNLRVEHTEAGLETAKAHFRLLIDRALELDGSFYLTYHRWARKDQILRAYPQFPEFLRLKRAYDPSERFQSDWYRHYKEMFSSP